MFVILVKDDNSSEEIPERTRKPVQIGNISAQNPKYVPTPPRDANFTRRSQRGKDLYCGTSQTVCVTTTLAERAPPSYY